MKVAFQLEELQKALAKVGTVVARKSAEPVYQHIRLFAKNGVVKITGVDIDSSLTRILPAAKSDEDGETLIKFAQLNDLVANFKGQTATIVTTEAGVTVKDDRKFSAKVKGYPVETFNALPVVQFIADRPQNVDETFPVIATLGLPGFKAQIEQVDFVAPVNDGKHVVSVAKVESTETALTLVATDGTRLAISSTPQNAGVFELLLPKPALEFIKKLDGGTSLTIAENDGGFYFATELDLLTYSKTHGEFPNYKSVVPKSNEGWSKYVFDKAEVVDSLKRLRPLADKEFPVAIFWFGENATTAKLEAASKEPTTGEGMEFRNVGEDEVNVSGTGPATDFSIDIAKVLPFIEKAEGPLVVFVKNNTTVIDFYANGEKYRWLQMPTNPANR